MMDPRKIGQFLIGEWEKTQQPIQERASVLPIGQYQDGRVGLAWPGVIADPAQRAGKALGAALSGDQSYYFGDDGRLTDDAIMAGIDLGGLAMTGGLGVGLAGGMVDNAVGSAGGKLTPQRGIGAALSSNDAGYLKAITDFAQSSGDGNVLNAIEWDRGRGYFNPPDDWEAVLASVRGETDAPIQIPETTNAAPKQAAASLPVQQALPLDAPLTQQAPQGIRAYHGSGFNIPIDTIPMYGTEKPFLWATDNPSLASEYADAGANFGSDYYWDNIKKRDGRDKPEQAAMVYPVEMRFQNPYEIDAGGALAAEIPWGRHFTNTEEIASSLADMGHDGVIIKNVRDYVSDENMMPGTVYGALKRGTVFSSTTGDQLFSNAPTGAVVPMGQAATEDQDPALLQVLRQFGMI